MTATIIDGNAIAKAVRAQWKERAEKLKARGVTPGLAVIIVGDNPASQVYVRNKVRACAEAGLYSEKIELPADTTEETLLARIRALNDNPAIHGILVQLPLPKRIDNNQVLEGDARNEGAQIVRGLRSPDNLLDPGIADGFPARLEVFPGRPGLARTPAN